MTKQTKPVLVKNALIVTCDRDHTVIEDGAVLVRGHNIEAVGPAVSITPGEADTIDAGGRILMPGLINMHCHAGDSLFRGAIEDLPLEDWLQSVWAAERATLSAENCNLGCRIGFAELLLSGVTTVMDMFWNVEETFKAADETGIRVATGSIFFDMTGMDGAAPEDRPRLARDLFERYGSSDRHFVGVTPHGAYTVGPDMMKTAWVLAEEFDGFFTTHAAETRTEQETIRADYGASVIRHLEALGVLADRSVLAHCVHVDAEEIGILARTGAHVAHNPMSNLKLASGFAPVPALLKAGINVTLGTDGPISGNDMDMWLSLRLAATLHKAVSGDAAAVSTQEALHMATLHGARALRAEQRLGSIEAGKEADFILVRRDRPHAIPFFSALNHLVFAANKADVTDVFVAGRRVVKDGVLTNVDPAALAREAEALKPGILDALQTAHA